MSRANGRGGASGLLRDDEQYDVFGVPAGDEARFLVELEKLGTWKPASTDGGSDMPKSMFGTPTWYSDWCEALSRAVWRGQVTELEASRELEREHRLMVLEMVREKLWRRPRKSSGRRRPRKVRFRWRGWTCADCDRQVGAFTGFCVGCHFAGWREVGG